MISNSYYLDESGNTGDLANTGRQFDFDNQPIFTLACVGIHDIGRLAAEVSRLKAAHGIASAELKASHLVNRPEFVCDLAIYLRRSNAPIFVEVIDKRFVICINIVEQHVLPPIGRAMDFHPRTIEIKNSFAEYLYGFMPASVAERFIATLCDPTRDAVRSSLSELEAWLMDNKSEHPLVSFILEGVANCLIELDAVPESAEHSHLRYLPSPDASKSGKPIWMLPNLACFSNIYARINLFHRREIANLRLFHDEQLQFDHVLRDGKIAAESLFGDGPLPSTPHADYHFTQQAELAFVRSDESVGIQVADVLAGFVMRYIKDGVSKPGLLRGGREAAFGTLLGMSDSALGTGINLVVPGSVMARLGIHWH